MSGSQKPPMHGDHGYLKGTKESTRLGLKGFPFLAMPDPEDFYLGPWLPAQPLRVSPALIALTPAPSLGISDRSLAPLATPMRTPARPHCPGHSCILGPCSLSALSSLPLADVLITSHWRLVQRLPPPRSHPGFPQADMLSLPKPLQHFPSS